jgi:methionyl-tRNA formyltransferase
MKNYVIACSKKWFYEYSKSEEFNKLRIHQVFKREDLSLDFLKKIKPRYIFFPHWSWKVEPEIFEKYECVAFHTAPLPFGRGGSPIQNLILRGHKNAPVCALRMSHILDGGPIYTSIEVSLDGRLTEIFERIACSVEKLILEICATNPVPIEQSGIVETFKRLSERDNELRSDYSIAMLYDRIRMVDGFDYPKAFIRNGSYKIEFSNPSFDGQVLTANAKFLVDIKVQKATLEDFDEILMWRNDELSRLMFRTQDYVSVEQHKKWFDDYLMGNNTTIYMGFWSEKKIGVCHFKYDKESKTSEVSINVNPNYRKLGLASQFLNNAIKEYRVNNNSIITAAVKQNNKPSIRVFKKCSFILTKQDENYFYLTLK